MSLPNNISSNRILPPADAQLVARIHRNAPIGQCLEEALQELLTRNETARETDEGNSGDNSSKEDNVGHNDSSLPAARTGSNVDDVEDQGEDTVKESPVPIDHAMVEQIMQTFGDAVASTKWRSDNDDSTTNENLPPAALLKGRVDHYNRFGGQWRMVVTNAEIVPRVELPEQRQTRKRNRPVLWDICSEKGGRASKFRVNGSMQLLAYNDM